MNHPTQNQWLLYVDGETSPEEAARLLEHLKKCPICSAEVTGWKRSAQKLQRMPFPARPNQGREPLRFSPFLQWGLAAAIVLCVGFAFGRLSALRAAALRQTVAAHVREDLNRELRADLLAALDPERKVQDAFQQELRLNLAKTTAQNNTHLTGEIMQAVQQLRQQDQQRVLTLIKDVRSRQISDCLALRRDLETAVSTADSDLRQDSRRISQLANTLFTEQQ